MTTESGMFGSSAPGQAIRGWSPSPAPAAATIVSASLLVALAVAVSNAGIVRSESGSRFGLRG